MNKIAQQNNLRSLSIILLLIASSSLVLAAPDWIWTSQKNNAKANEIAYFRKSFKLDKAPTKATLFASCDNQFQGWVNGKSIGGSSEWSNPLKVDVTKALTKNDNVIAIRGGNDSGSIAGLIVRLDLEFEGAEKHSIESNSTWRFSSKEREGWKNQDFQDSDWSTAVSLGKLGTSPWGNIGGGGAPKRPDQATSPEQLQIADGFRAELIYSVPKQTQGSWVSLTKDDKGRLIASDQGNLGLFRITVDGDGETHSAAVEKINVDISGAQGLVWAFDGLYVNKSGKGLMRITDTNGDDQLDQVEFLGGSTGGGEHGNHAVILTEDKKGLYIEAGNHTDLPAGITKSRINMNWQEDLLLPRQWDARGHARGRLAPGGWIARISSDAKDWEIISVGYRNQYDIAINRHGEMFTFDADMEWDMGSPWYRPTRICHVVSGSEFGWRSGTGKWPTYYEDSLPPAVEIGPGSPTGAVFGTGAEFPTKYQDALYALDWTFGTVWAVHLTPKGAGYVAEKEEFITGSPFPVTDAIVGDDGALYITAGGRGTQSGLYRVSYIGDESTQAASRVANRSAARERARRKLLERFHGKHDSRAIDYAWPYLNSEDRFLRYAARIAIESQPVDQWRERALTEQDPLGKAVAAIALARTGTEASSDSITEKLLQTNLASTPKTATLATLRAYALAFIRFGSPNAELKQQSIETLDALLPSSDKDINTELIRLLVFLDAPSVIEKGLALMTAKSEPIVPDWSNVISRNGGYGGSIQKMLDNHPPIQEINYAFMLRNVRYGWTLDQRRTFFEFVIKAAQLPGGASYPGFLKNIGKDALANCSLAERNALQSITGEASLAKPKPFNVTPPTGPGKDWSVADAVGVHESGLSNRNFQSGRNLFHASACAACHRFDGEGGAIGPDLSTVRNKFSVNDLLESIIEPSKVISDQYGSSIVTTRSGETIEGLAVKASKDGKEGWDIYLPNPTSEPKRVETSEVASIVESKVSQMPQGLVNGLNSDELKDLVAYLLSRGNPNDSMFKKASE